MFFILLSYFLFSSILVWPTLVTVHVNMPQVEQGCLLSIITSAACVVAGEVIQSTHISYITASKVCLQFITCAVERKLTI